MVICYLVIVLIIGQLYGNCIELHSYWTLASASILSLPPKDGACKAGVFFLGGGVTMVIYALAKLYLG